MVIEICEISVQATLICADENKTKQNSPKTLKQLEASYPYLMIGYKNEALPSRVFKLDSLLANILVSALGLVITASLTLV